MSRTSQLERGARIAGIFVLALVAGIATALVTSCNPMLSPDPPAVHPPDGACAAAEQHLRDLGCVTEASTGGGFGAFCEREAARAIDFHPQCISRVTACAQFSGASRGEGC